jgi:hypothetical protein
MKTEYTISSLYDVIKNTLLFKDKDLMRFLLTMNESLLIDFKKIKKMNKISHSEIISRYETYSIVYLMIRNILRENNINNFDVMGFEITNLFLKDKLVEKENKNTPSVYDED